LESECVALRREIIWIPGNKAINVADRSLIPAIAVPFEKRTGAAPRAFTIVAIVRHGADWSARSLFPPVIVRSEPRVWLLNWIQWFGRRFDSMREMERENPKPAVRGNNSRAKRNYSKTKTKTIS